MALIQRILVPTDFSDCAKRALEYAAELSAKLAAEVVLVHVYAPPTVFLPEGAVLFPMKDSELRAQLGAGLDKVALEARALGAHPTRTVFAEGDAAREIVRVAREEHCDLIVMGTHGRAGIRHLVLGSVAERVVRKADCAVLSVGPRAVVDPHAPHAT